MTRRVLHVTACFSTGVARAISTMVEMTPELEHHLLWEGDDDPTDVPFASAERLPAGLPARVRAVRRAARRTRCDVVHAHSSRAGVYARLAGVRAEIIYQPHAYKLLDPALVTPVRAPIHLVERILGSRTDQVVVLSGQEEQLARRLAPQAAITLLPNVPSLADHGPQPPSGLDRRRSVVMSGRVTAQKDPAYLADVARELRKADRTVSVRWLGGPDDPQLADRLVRQGVTVTGWLPPEELARELSQAGVYLHTATYEGFPLSVLDAAWCRAPVLVRDIPAFAGTALASVGPPAEAAARSLAVLDDPVLRRRVCAGSESLLTTMSREGQRRALARIYRLDQPACAATAAATA